MADMFSVGLISLHSSNSFSRGTFFEIENAVRSCFHDGVLPCAAGGLIFGISFLSLLSFSNVVQYCTFRKAKSKSQLHASAVCLPALLPSGGSSDAFPRLRIGCKKLSVQSLAGEV